MAKTDPEINQGHLLHNIVLFGRLLRRLDIDVTPTHLINLVKAMKYLDLSQHQEVQNASRTILINHHQNLALFDLIFDLLARFVCFTLVWSCYSFSLCFDPFYLISVSSSFYFCLRCIGL